MRQCWANPNGGTSGFISTSGVNFMLGGGAIRLRGTNFNNEPALACCGGPNINQINVNAADYQQARTLGANHVRFGIDYFWYSANRNRFFTVLDQHLLWARQAGLWVYLVCFIPPGGSSGGFDQSAASGYCFWSDCAGGAANQALLTAMWKDIATHFAGNQTLIGYDILNEPAPPTNAEWVSFATATYNAIKSVDPNHIVIIEAPANNDLVGFVGITTRVAYSVHHYTGGDNYPTQQPANTPLIIGEVGGQHSNPDPLGFVAAELARYETDAKSYSQFTWRSNGFGLYKYLDYSHQIPGDFSLSWPEMIAVVSPKWLLNTAFPRNGPLTAQDIVFVESRYGPTSSPAPAGNAIVPAGWIRQIGSDGEIDMNLTLNGKVVPTITQFVVPYYTGGWPPDPLTGTPGHTPQRPTGEG